MSRPNVKIVTDGCKAQIFIDGEKVSGVRGYYISHRAGQAPSLYTTYILDAMSIYDNGMIAA